MPAETTAPNSHRQDEVLSGRCLAVLLLSSGATVLLGAWATWWLLGRPAPGIDDAYITLVYGRNLAAGSGYVYTPGYERVEGSTSLLWTLVTAAAARVSAAPQTLLLGLSLVVTALAIACFARTVDRLQIAAGSAARRRTALLACLLWVLAQPDFFAWNTLTLMDSAIWCLLVAAALLLLSSDATRERLPRSGVAPAILFAAMALARPESLALVPALLALTAAALGRPWQRSAVVRRYGPALAAFALTEAALALFRMTYFGYPLPNTYYVKAPAVLYALQKGLGYLAWFARARPWAIPLLAVTSGWFVKLARDAARPRGLSKAFDRGVFVVAGAVLAGLALPLPTGGDGFGSFRLLQPFVLFFAVPAIPLLLSSPRFGPLWERHGALRLGVTALLVLALAAIAHRFSGDNLLAGEFAAARDGQRAGEVLANMDSRSTPSPTVGVIAAGGLAWTYPGRVVDLLGLNWPKMAHAAGPREGVRHGHGAFQAEVFWSDSPDILVLDLASAIRPISSEGELRTEFASEVLKDLPASSRFAEAYAPGCVSDSAGVVSGYFARSWLVRAQPASYSPVPCRAP